MIKSCYVHLFRLERLVVHIEALQRLQATPAGILSLRSRMDVPPADARGHSARPHMGASPRSSVSCLLPLERAFFLGPLKSLDVESLRFA